MTFNFLKYSIVYTAAMIIAIITVIIEVSKPNAPPINMSGPDIDAVTTETSSIGFPEAGQPFIRP